MKRNLASLLCLFAFITFLACQKQAKTNFPEQTIRDEINAWLIKQKSPGQPLKAANIDLLMNNLVFTGLITEITHNGEKLLIIPIAEQFKKQKGINNESEATLLISLNAAGSIGNMNIVLYSPKNTIDKTIPTNTFHAIATTGKSTYTGELRFLSVTGRKLSSLTFESGRLSKESRLTEKNNARGTEQSCIDWYLITTIYYTDGTCYTTEDYIGTTCSGCDCGDIQCDCPDDPGEGNGSAQCETLDPESGAQSVSEKISETVEDIAQLRKYKKPRWRVLKGVGWDLYSTESGIVHYSNNVWTWESFDHVGIDFVGMTVGGTVTHTQGTGTPSFVAGTPNVQYAGMSVNFSVTYQALGNCPGAAILLAPRTMNYSANAVWSAQP